DVQSAAVDSLLNLYTVRTDLAKRPWGVPAIGRATTFAESAFEAGPLATIPAAVPPDVVINLSTVMLHDEALRLRLAAASALGWLRYDRAVQALTDHASYYGKGEDGAAALHALARIAASGSAPVMRAQLANQFVPFRLLSIEGLGRIGDQGALPQIQESAAS